MKTILMVLCAQMAISGLTAQSVATRSNVNVKTSGYNIMVNITDKDGKPFEPDMNVNGTPFYNDDWVIVNLATTDGKAFANIKARVNLHQSTLHFLNSKGVEMYLETQQISRIEVLDTLNPGKLLATFIKMTSTNKAGNKEHNLYQVQSEGKIMFLRQLRKKVQVLTHEYSKETTRTYEQYENYFAFAKNELLPVKRNKAFCETLMQDQWNAVETYADNNNLGFKSYSDIAQLVQYYNGLK